MAARASVIVEPESSPFKSRQEWTAIRVCHDADLAAQDQRG